MQETHVLVELGQTVLLLFGGGGVVLVAVCGFFAKFIADRTIERRKAELSQETERLKAELAIETETHRLKLKKMEILTNKEIEAAGEFISLHRNIRPSYSYPDMDWAEALEEVATEFGKIERLLGDLLVSYGAVIETTARQDLVECTTLVDII
jgi:Tfp pilus assembly protein FimV